METKPVDFWVKEIEEHTGIEIMMNTSACIIHKYKTDNNTCKGCLFELNCAKLSNIMMTQFHVSTYKPANFVDHLTASQQAVMITLAIMDAKSTEEIEKIVLRSPL